MGRSSGKPADHGDPSRNGCPPAGQPGVTRPRGPARGIGVQEFTPPAAPPEGVTVGARPGACGFPLGRAPQECLLP